METANEVTPSEPSSADNEQMNDSVATSLQPSHILANGRFVHLPPPTDADCQRFFERSIARHGLLDSNLSEKQEIKEEKDQKTEPKVHPLAMASARIRTGGIDELNRAINLSTLVQTNEFLGLSNIVDPALETKDTTASTAPVPDAKIKSLYVLQRKRQQFDRARTVLDRHQKRLAAAIVAQRIPDARWRRLRPTWRLVAPEHGTKALAHAARPTEITAADVEVYGVGGQALGRVARKVPRFATLEVDDLDIKPHCEQWESKYASVLAGAKGGTDEDDAMDVEETMKPPDDEKNSKILTRAEPFALADPTLGKLDADFDPNKVAMLTLQFKIIKTSTGFSQCSNLEPIARSIREQGSVLSQDEQVLSDLQHSLFCAKLFESFRRELTPDTGDLHAIAGNDPTAVVWVSTRSEESFVPPPTQMIRGSPQLVPLSITHCHEGEVQVQLNVEYSLCVKLVERSAELETREPMATDSGSQSPERLLAYCRALLLHAQESYHDHSLESAAAAAAASASNGKDDIHARKDASQNQTHILQECVSLGAKLLLECDLRRCIQRVQSFHKDLEVDWLPLSVLDWHAHVTLSRSGKVWDIRLECDSLVVTSGTKKKVHFRSAWELEIFLEAALGRVENSTN